MKNVLISVFVFLSALVLWGISVFLDYVGDSRPIHKLYHSNGYVFLIRWIVVLMILSYVGYMGSVLKRKIQELSDKKAKD